MKTQLLMLLAVVGLLFGSTALYGTNGYFSSGYGTQYKGMVGAGVAYPRSSLAAAVNPAAMSFVGTRYDIGIGFFIPLREYTVTGNPSGFPGTFPLTPETVESGKNFFVVPNIGMNWMLKDKTSLGLAIYGNGGMNTEYDTKVFNNPNAPVTSPTGVNLSQVFIAPNFSQKIGENHSFGISVLLGYQWFKAYGLQAFGNFTADAAALTDNNTDHSFGAGFKIGYLGYLTDDLSLGASYQSKIFMSKFSEYSGLFAQQGDFDIPCSWTAGLAYSLGKVVLLADVQQILYSKVEAVGNPLNLLEISPLLPDGSPNPNFVPLGAEGASGFGWENMWVFKLATEILPNDNWAMRAGYSYGTQPVPDSEVMFNILAPGIIQHHASLGFSWFASDNKEVSLAFSYAFSNTVNGYNPFEAPEQQEIELKMQQFEIELGFSIW